MGPAHLPSDKLQRTSEVQCPQAISQALPPGNGPHGGEDRVTVRGMGRGPQTAVAGPASKARCQHSGREAGVSRWVRESLSSVDPK